MNKSEKICLLNPGPVTLTESVRRSMQGPDLCHREPAFSELMQQVRSELVSIYPADADRNTAVLLTGSGTVAVESMVTSLTSPDHPTLVCANGVYGERIATMLQMHGKPYRLLKHNWTDPIDLQRVDDELKECPSIRHVVAVHHETTTGRLNDIAALGELVGRHGKTILLDAVSSFAGTDIQFEAWNIEAAAATANKCLHGVPGMAFVIVRKDRLANEPSSASSLYLDLWTNHTAQDSGYPAFTPAIQSLYALRAALTELRQSGGVSARAAHYRALTKLVLGHAERLGLSPLITKSSDRSDILTSLQLPEGVAFDDLYDGLRRQNFVIYAGQKQFFEQIFRIAVMGDLASDDMNRFGEVLESVISSNRAA